MEEEMNMDDMNMNGMDMNGPMPMAEDEGMSMEDIMGYISQVEEMLGLQPGTIMGALVADGDMQQMALASLTAKINTINGAINGLRTPSEGIMGSLVDFVGGMLSSALGRIDEADVGFPDKMDASTGLIRAIGEVAKFLQSFDEVATAMAPNADRSDNHMVELFIRNLDNLMAGALELLNLQTTIVPPEG